MKISYNWLKSYVPELPEAEKLWDVFTFHLCEVEGMVPVRADGSLADPTSNGIHDWIFDINILPNRAHDLLCHQGVAQELSAILTIEYKSPVEFYKIPDSSPTKLKISIESDKCRRYMGRVVRNVTVGPSPEWVVKYLESIGQRSINNIVDATNIVLFDCGQPTHAFDAHKLQVASEKLQVVIQNAKDGEELELLGSEKNVVKLRESDLVITNGDGKTLAIAGVKGSTNSGVTDQTKDIVLEVANFDPVSVRKTGRGLGLLSDAQKRFENDLSPERAPYAMRELSALIMEMCPGATFEDSVDVYPNPQQEMKIEVSLEYINKKLGSEFLIDEIENVWKRLQFVYVTLEARPKEFVWEIVVPVLRLDLTGPHDLVEEVGRILGYDRLTPEIPKIDFKPQINETTYRILVAKQKLLADGYREVMTYSFTNKGEVEVLASASDKKFLRTNLADGLKESIVLNNRIAPLLGLDFIKVFEVGSVFMKGKEEMHIAFGDTKNVTELTLEEFTKDIGITDSYSDLLQPTTYNLQPVFIPWSPYPFITRDIATWVPEGTDPDVLISIYKEEGGELLVTEPKLFDTFTKPASTQGGEGRTSLAFRLVFQAFDRTLTDIEVNERMEQIVDKLKGISGLEIR